MNISWMVNNAICDSIYRNKPVEFKVDVLLFPTGLFFQLNLGAKILEITQWIFFRNGNFIIGIITDWWKVNFEKKALKVWDFGRIGVFKFKFFKHLIEEVLNIPK